MGPMMWLVPRDGSQDVRQIPSVGALGAPKTKENLLRESSAIWNLTQTDRFPTKVGSRESLTAWERSSRGGRGLASLSSAW